MTGLDSADLDRWITSPRRHEYEAEVRCRNEECPRFDAVQYATVESEYGRGAYLDEVCPECGTPWPEEDYR